MRQFLEDVTGLSIYPMLSLVLFFAVFGFMLFLVFTMDKKKIERIKQLPLQDDYEVDPQLLTPEARKEQLEEDDASNATDSEDEGKQS